MNIKLKNKEISWLSFNERVLQEANDPTVPLIERLKFLGISSSNLDEFYRVRVATLKRLALLGKKAKKIIGEDPLAVLQEIKKPALKQHNKVEITYNQLLQELAKENIFVINETQLLDGQSEFITAYFQNEVRPKLVPIMIDQIEQFPELKDGTLYLAVHMSRKDDPDKFKYALIEIPGDVLPRYLTLPAIGGNKYVILLDDVIRYGLNDIFSPLPYDTFRAYTIKLTRDAELDIDTDLAESYLSKIRRSLKQRKEGNPIRFTHDGAIDQELLKFLIKKLNLTKNDAIISGSRYHNNRDLIRFPKIGARNLSYPELKSLNHKDFEPSKSIFKAIHDKDILLHYPYQTYNYVTDILREASIDPKVSSIKFTLYRVAKNSSVMNALINAVKNGKSVFTVLELQARFDEEANIDWATRLRDEGVKVIYGIPGLKVHAKLCLITRKEKGKNFNYAIIGTGNFNEETAKSYSDHSLFTANKKLTAEVDKIFEFLENTYKLSTFKHLIVSPNFMRKKMNKLIENEIKNFKKGKTAYIHIKINHLTDPVLIGKLYRASEAGVKIRLIVRGMFSLIPGYKGISSNIEAISIVDRFLEHSRILIFANGGEEKYFLSSADLMPRNLDRRVEVICPIYDRDIKSELRKFFDIQWQDNVRARILDEALENKIRTDPAARPIRAQWEIYDYLKNLRAGRSESKKEELKG
jgi:polyphosphate kinase